MENNLLSSRPVFDAKVLTRGAVIQVESKLFDPVLNSNTWNALILKVEPFELVVAKIPGDKRGFNDSDEDTSVEKKTLGIDGVVRGATKITLLLEK